MVMLIWHLLTSLHPFGFHRNIHYDICEIWCQFNWGNTYIGCILKVKCHQCGNIYLAFAYITACIWGPWAMGAQRIIDVKPVVNWIKGALLILEVMYNIPFFCVVQNSCFHCCTIFLFCDVQYSFTLWCTIFLFAL